MNDLTRTVLDLVDHVDEATMASPTAIRARGDQRRRRTTIAALAAAVVVVAAGAAVTVTTGPAEAILPSGRVDSDNPDPGGRASEYDVRLPGPGRVEALASAGLGSRFVIVGSVGNSSDRAPTAGIWWSDGGRVWARTGPTSGRIEDVVATGDGFVAVGSGPNGPRVLYSSDGQHWTDALVDSGPYGNLTMVEDTPLGLFAWEAQGRGGSLWRRSTDGIDWSETRIGGPEPRVCQAKDTEDGLELLGLARARDGSYHATRWTSPDGVHWSEPNITAPTADYWCLVYGPGTFHDWTQTDTGLLYLSSPQSRVDLKFYPQ